MIIYNIAIILPYLKVGGTERQAYYLANYFKNKSDIKLNVIVIEKTGGLISHFEKFNPIYLDVGFRKRNTLIIIYRLIKLLYNEKIDFLISRAWNTNMITVIASLFTRTKSILFLSGPLRTNNISFIKRLFQRTLLKIANKIISVSHKARENCMALFNLSGKNIFVVHNGIDIEMISKSAQENKIELLQNKFRILFNGRLIYRKGLDVLLKALVIIARELESLKNIELLVIGDGDLTDQYKQFIKENNLHNHVLFLGEKTNPFPYFLLSDVFVLPSRSEGFPNALLEAMALGLPVISTDCETGPAEIINNNNGIIVPVDNYQELANAILKLYTNEKLLKKLGINAKETTIQKYQLTDKLALIEKTIFSKG